MAITKDPASVLDYGQDWTLWLGSDAIAVGGSTWRVEGPDLALAIDTTKPATSDGKVTKVWLTGGTAGAVYGLVNRITTTGGRVDERTMQIVVRQK